MEDSCEASQVRKESLEVLMIQCALSLSNTGIGDQLTSVLIGLHKLGIMKLGAILQHCCSYII